MNGKAAVEKLNINVNTSSIEIFSQIVAAFQLPFPSVSDYYGKDCAILIEALICAIRNECRKAEIANNTAHNLQVLADRKDKTITELKEDLDRVKSILQENQNASKDLMIQHQKIKDQNERLTAENKALLEQNQKLTEQLAYLKKDKFGAKSEKLDDLTEHVLSGEEVTDPLSEEDPGKEETAAGRKSQENGSSEKKVRQGKPRRVSGKKENDLSRLPTQTVFEYDIEKLNEQYGEHNWRFAFWRSHTTVEVSRAVTYRKIIMTPVISYGVEHQMETVPYDPPLWQKSLFTPSLLSDIIIEKYRKFVTLYRLENDPDHYGFSIPRQTMSNCVIRAALEFFMPVYLYLQSLLVFYPYQQCDETTWRVLRDGRKSGARSYFWAHRSSELYKDKPPIILYALELTRSGDHLIRFYKDLIEKGGQSVKITSDAYRPYPALEENCPEVFTSCGCLSHARRRYVIPFAMISGNKLTEEELHVMDEWKALDMITSIYAEEALLKDLTAADRLEQRKARIAPIVDQYFDFIKTMDTKDPKYSSAFRDAVMYSLNQEKYLRRFLEDGNVPIDDNACERSIRTLTLLRKNSLFSNTVEGAVANGIIMTLIETARANGADPYYYIKYLLDNIPASYYSGGLDEKIRTLAPWTDEYKNYEQIQKRLSFDRAAPESDQKPHTPRKRDQLKSLTTMPAMA